MTVSWYREKYDAILFTLSIRYNLTLTVRLLLKCYWHNVFDRLTYF